MRYYEKRGKVELNNPTQVMVDSLCTFLSAPFRLLVEISKKIVLLGKERKKFLLVCVISNTSIIILKGIDCLFISKRVNFYNGVLSMASMAISLIILTGLYLLIGSSNIDYDTEREQSQDELSVNNVSSIIEDSTIMDAVAEDKVESVSMEEVLSAVDKVDETKVSDLYRYTVENDFKNKLNLMKPDEDNMSDIDKEDREYISSEVSDKEASDLGLEYNEPSFDEPSTNFVGNTDMVLNQDDIDDLLDGVI